MAQPGRNWERVELLVKGTNCHCPDKFNGKMECWEERSWSVKSYAAWLKAEATEMMDPITDEVLERMQRHNADL